MQSIGQYNLIFSNWPVLSLAAWGQLLAEFPVRGSGLPPTTGGAGFEEADIQPLLLQPNDDWVFLYERIQERLARQARSKGEAQQGVFYTPVSIAHYLVQQTLGVYLAQQLRRIEQAVSGQRLQAAQADLQRVESLKLIDPACGTGVFLVEALKKLHAFYGAIQQQYPVLKLQGSAAYSVCHQLYGLDLDPASVFITRLRLAQWVGWLDCQHEPLNLPLHAELVQCADTLSTPLFAEMAWHFVLGNPPYISEVRKQAKRFAPLQTSGFYQPKMDLCDAFTAWAIHRLEPEGQLAYVLPQYWTQRTSSAPLRALLWQEGRFQEICTFGATPVFKNAPGHHTALLVWQKGSFPQPDADSQPVLWGQPDAVDRLSHCNLQPAILFRQTQSGKFLLGAAVEIALLQRLSSLPPLLAPRQIQQGVVLPQGRLKFSDWKKLPSPQQAKVAPGSGIFLLNQAEVRQLQFGPEEAALLKPYYGPAGFLPFQGVNQAPSQYQLVYTDASARRAMALKPEQYARLKAHLDGFASILTSAFKPYGLHRARQKKWFESPEKIVCARQVMSPAFAVVPQCAYVSEGFYVLLPEGNNPAYWCALLNSRLGWYWFYHQKRKGHRLQVDKDVLLTFPQPRFQEPERVHQLSALSEVLAGELHPSQRKDLTEALNQLVDAAYGVTATEKDCMQAAYHSVFESRVGPVVEPT
ncbi:Eco57I restriction-modification methylase domain-containing protein [Vampirovibrio sp.]|uniref:Eco57I restriction-modification methylase domain-containing protein n=1 Tax=Vampirovibrio sp. TaxID=2717857 RepID=UPI00359414F0